MGVTHFDAFFDEEHGCDIAFCGTPVGENYEHDNDWKYVSCKKCLKNRKYIDEEIQLTIEHRAKEDAEYLESINPMNFFP